MSHSSPVFKNSQGEWHVDSTRRQRQAVAEGKIRISALTHGHYPGHLLPPRVLPGLSSIGYLDVRGEQDWGMEPHRNEGIEIAFLETGHMEFLVEGYEYRLTGGDMTITPPWQLHCVGNPNLGVGRLHWLILDVGVRRANQKWVWPPWVLLRQTEIRDLTAALRHTRQWVWKSTADVRHAFHEIAVCVEHYPTRRPLTRLKLQVNQLLLSVWEAIGQQRDTQAAQDSGGPQVVAGFLEQLRQDPRLAAQPWSVAQMAEHCGMGTTKFATLCHTVANSSPWEYLIGCRLRWAAEQLQSCPQRPITQVALACGFSTSQHFAACFAKRYHCPPREYRKRRPATGKGKDGEA